MAQSAVIDQSQLQNGVTVRLYPPRHHMSASQYQQPRGDASAIPVNIFDNQLDLDTVMDFCLHPDMINSQYIKERIAGGLAAVVTRGQGANPSIAFWDSAAWGNTQTVAMNYAFFPVVFVSGAQGKESITVAPYICIYSEKQMPLISYSAGSAPVYRAYRFPTAQGSDRTVNIDTRYIRGEDAWASFLTAMSTTVAQENSFITIAPFVSDSVYSAHLNHFGDNGAWSFSGTSFGLSAMMACMGAPPIMYTGFIKSLPNDQAVYHSSSGWGVAEVPRQSTIVESVQFLDFKALWAARFNFPIVMPAIGFMREPLAQLFKTRSDIDRVVRTGQTAAVVQVSRDPRADAHPFLVAVGKLIYTNAQLEAGIPFQSAASATPLLMSSDPISVAILASIAYAHFVYTPLWNTTPEQQQYAQLINAPTGTLSSSDASSLPAFYDKLAYQHRARLHPQRQPPATAATKQQVYALRDQLAQTKLQARAAASSQRLQQQIASIGSKQPRGPSRSGAVVGQHLLPGWASNTSKQNRKALKNQGLLPQGLMDAASARGIALAKNPAAQASQIIMKLATATGARAQQPAAQKGVTAATRAIAVQRMFAGSTATQYGISQADFDLVAEYYAPDGYSYKSHGLPPLQLAGSVQPGAQLQALQSQHMSGAQPVAQQQQQQQQQPAFVPFASATAAAGGGGPRRYVAPESEEEEEEEEQQPMQQQVSFAEDTEEVPSQAMKKKPLVGKPQTKAQRKKTVGEARFAKATPGPQQPVSMAGKKQAGLFSAFGPYSVTGKKPKQ